jgi:MarR family transcriptional regulator, organic hydroperoxide resistance regulator
MKQRTAASHRCRLDRQREGDKLHSVQVIERRDMATRRTSRKRSGPLTVSRRELLAGDSDETFRHFIHGLLAFAERVFAVRAGFGELVGLSGIQYTVLVSIAHLQNRSSVSVGHIAAHLHLSGAFITTVTNQLEALDLIRKAKDGSDRRRAVLLLTSKGQQRLEQLAPVQQQVNDVLFAPLTRDQFRKLAAMMDQWVDAGDRAVGVLTYLKQSQAPVPGNS